MVPYHHTVFLASDVGVVCFINGLDNAHYSSMHHAVLLPIAQDRKRGSRALTLVCYLLLATDYHVYRRTPLLALGHASTNRRIRGDYHR